MTRIARQWFFVVCAVAVLAAVETTGWVAIPSWTITSIGNSRASPQQLWSWYEDTKDWPNWDHLVDQVQTEGPFKTGTIGKSVAGGISVRTELTDVLENKSYTEIMHLPLATLIATHQLISTTAGTQIEHGIQIRGAGAWIFYFLMRNDMQAGMNDAMHRLAARAAEGLPTDRIP